MKIDFLIFDHVEELDLVGSWELIGLLSEQGVCQKPKLIGVDSMTPTGEHGMRFSADVHFSKLVDADLPDVLIVPGGRGARQAMLDDVVMAFLQRCERHAQAILGVCTGMYLLYQAGLLQGRRATTHWAFLKNFCDDDSLTIVQERFVQDGNIWTSAGVSAGMDMTLAFIAHTFGEAVASEVQLQAEYYPDGKVYGRPQDMEGVAGYIKKLK